MAQTSFYWEGTSLTDAGPYEENTSWRHLVSVGLAGGVNSDSNLYNIGVFYAIDNHLDAAINGTDIDVDTGASLVDGTYHENDAIVSIDIGSVAARPTVNPRIDYIVVRKNYSTISTYTPANSTATVPPRTARITVIRGTEAASPVAPSLTQDTTSTTYWDIPIATVQVSTGGVLSNLTDAREFVDAETKYVFVQVQAGYNATDGTDVTVKTTVANSVYPNVAMILNKDIFAMGKFIIPSDYISDGVVTALFTSNNNGNLECEGQIEYGACGEQVDQHSDTFAKATVAISVVDFEEQVCEAEISLTSATSGDIATALFERYGSDVLDTINGTINFMGWVFQYFGWKK